ncbi:MAG: hypothetical protein JWR56_1198 [Massilia sp.]|nr:hypothetical protein [Massilia sp.]
MSKSHWLLLSTAFCESDDASPSITITRLGLALLPDSVLYASLIGPIAVPLAMPIGLVFKAATGVAGPGSR